MHVADDVLVLLDAANDVAVPHLDMINVKQQLDSWRPNAVEYRRNIVDVVSLVARVPFHRMRVIARVEMFQANGNAFFFCIAGDLRKCSYAVVGALFWGDFSAIGILGRNWLEP